MINRCPICDGDEHSTIWRARSPLLPIARARPSGYGDLFSDIEIVVCHRCGCGINRTFSPELANRLYGDVALTNIPVDPSMHLRLEAVVQSLPKDAIAGGHVLEIGAGGGHLARLVARHAKRVTLVEPCRALTRVHVPESNIDLVHDVFPGRAKLPKANLILARQVLEHVDKPAAFMQAIADGLTEDGYAYVEVPNAEYIERHGALFDVHAQHVQYFRPAHVIELGRRARLAALRPHSIKDGHDFGILFRRDDNSRRANVVSLGGGRQTATRWRNNLNCRARRLARLALRNLGRVSLYGATMHGAVFLNLLSGASELPIASVIDDNAGYAGYGLYTDKRFHPISYPEAQVLSALDTIVITAYLHDAVIGRKLRQRGFLGQLLTTRVAPSDGELASVARIFRPLKAAPYSA